MKDKQCSDCCMHADCRACPEMACACAQQAEFVVAPIEPAKAETVLIVGNTYPVKNALKSMGGKWDPDARGWRVPAEVASKAQALVA